MSFENSHARAAFNWCFKNTPGCHAKSNRNLVAYFLGARRRGEQAPPAGEISKEDPDKGRPDFFVDMRGCFWYVECKAAAGSISLGEYREEQREYAHEHTAGPVFIGLMMYPERNPTRLYIERARFYLVPLQEWINAEDFLFDTHGTRTLALTSDLERVHALKNMTVDNFWRNFELTNNMTSLNPPKGLLTIPEEFINQYGCCQTGYDS